MVGVEVGEGNIMVWEIQILFFSPIRRKFEVSGCCGIPISLSFCYLEFNH